LALRKAFFRKITIVALLAVVLALSHSIWFRWLGEFLVKSEEPFHADAVIVLAGDWNGDRVLRGAELVKQGFAPIAFISGPGYVYGINEGELAIEFAMKHGYPREYFEVMPSTSFSTRDEAAFSSSWLRARNVHKLMVVTNDFHTRRASKFFRAALGSDVEFRMIAVPDRFFSPDGWWHNREGQKVFFFEWSKTIAEVFGV